MAICPSDQWSQSRFAVLVAAFDTAGTEHDQPLIMTAGFVSSAKDWVEFDLLWRTRLAKDGIEYFHMVDFAQSRGQFEGWSGQETKRRALYGDLVELISRHAYRKFGCGISMRKWQTLIDREHMENFKLNAISVTGMMCVARVDHWAARERIETPIEIIFEDGDAGQTELREHLLPRKPNAIFKPKRAFNYEGRIVPAFTPLQAADILAYELFVRIREVESQKDSEWTPPRFGLLHFDKMPETIAYFEPKDFSNLNGLLTGIEQLLPFRR